MTRDSGPIGADLTPREREVLGMVAAGMTNREIGEALFISESTAGVHVSNLMAKLGVGSRTEAAALAYRAGLVESVAGVPAAKTAAVEPRRTSWWDRLSLSFRQQLERHPRRVAAAGVGALGVLLLATVGLAMAVFGEAPVAGEADPTASARPATPTPRPTPSPAPIGGADVELEVDGLAQVLAEGVTLRAEPGTQTRRIGELPQGDVGFVVAGPTIEDGYAWYQLAAVDPYGASCQQQPPGSLACQEWFGWAAAGATDGEPWLAALETACPARGDLAGLIALKPLEGLSCFGAESMSVRVYRSANRPAGECFAHPIDPPWLASACLALAFEDDESLYPSGDALVVHQSLAPAEACLDERDPNCPVAPWEGRWVQINVHFDDPAAEDCRALDNAVPIPDPDATVLRCRAALVLTGVDSADDLGYRDQEQKTSTPEFPTGYQPNGNGGAGLWAGVAQTYTAGRNGELTAIQLRLNRLERTSGALVIEIRRNGPTGELLATSPPTNWADLPVDTGICLPPQCLALNRELAWVTVRFDQPAWVTGGQTYAIVFAPGHNTAATEPTFFLGGTTADLYPGGLRWTRDPGDAQAWQPHSSGADLAFRTILR